MTSTKKRSQIITPNEFERARIEYNNARRNRTSEENAIIQAKIKATKALWSQEKKKEVSEKLSAASKKHRHTEETRKKQSESLKKYYASLTQEQYEEICNKNRLSHKKTPEQIALLEKERYERKEKRRLEKLANKVPKTKEEIEAYLIKKSEKMKIAWASKTTEEKEIINDKIKDAWNSKTLDEMNEIKDKMRKSKEGMLFWNNGIKCIRAKEQPGPEWNRGRLKEKAL